MSRLFILRIQNRIIVACGNMQDEFGCGYHISKVGGMVFFMCGASESNSQDVDLKKFDNVIKENQELIRQGKRLSDSFILQQLKDSVKNSYLDGIYAIPSVESLDYDGEKIQEPSVILVKTLDKHRVIGSSRLEGTEAFEILNCLDGGQVFVKNPEYKCVESTKVGNVVENMLNQFGEINSIEIKEWEEIEVSGGYC